MPPKKKMIISKEKNRNNDSKQPILFHDVIRWILKRLSFVDFHRARRISSVRYSASKSCLVLFPNNNRSCKLPTLPLDLVISILERLSFVDFLRARCVSSEWYFASKSCNRRTSPWLILFPKENEESKTKISCKLFDPRDHNKTYKVRDLGFDFATSRCLASSGSWLLMLDDKDMISQRERFVYLLNIFTRERIPLPSLVIEYPTVYQRAILWVNEKSRDYLVVLSYDGTSLAYHRRGDDTNSWKVFQPLLPIRYAVFDLVFRESKLYVLRTDGMVITPNIIVFDFSSCGDDNDFPKECASIPPPDLSDRDRYKLHQLAMTLSGEILFIVSDVKPCYFDVYKMDPKSSKWSIIKSIGNEVLLLDLGTTVAAKDGVMRNCIYFGNSPKSNRIFGKSLSNDDYCICVYDIQTNKVFQRFRRFPGPFKDARWFLPTSGGKCLL